MRTVIRSDSPLENAIGFARACRIGPYIAISGTAPIGPKGQTIGGGDVFAQTQYCLKIALNALQEAGGTPEDVIRTRIMLTDINTWAAAARAHGDVFGTIHPACTFVEVSAFIRPDWLVEIEVDAVIGG